MDSLGINVLLVPNVFSGNEADNECPIVLDILEIIGSTELQCSQDAAFEMAVSALDGTILMGDPAIVARWRHSVMLAQ